MHSRLGMLMDGFYGPKSINKNRLWFWNDPLDIRSRPDPDHIMGLKWSRSKQVWNQNWTRIKIRIETIAL